MKIISAPWVVPVSSPMIEDGAVALDNGRIVSVGKVSDIVKEFPGAPHERMEGSLLMPALVNAHAHLELTLLGPLPEELDFIGWILEIIKRKRAATDADFSIGIEMGARICLEYGQSVVADVLSRYEFGAHYPPHGPRILCMPEVICPGDEGAGTLVDRAAGVKVGGNAELAGLFAHSPYTAGRAAQLACGEAAKTVKAGGSIFATHLAESVEEIEFCESDSGPIVDRLYASLPVSPPASPGMHPLRWLDLLSLLGPNTLLIHCVQLEKGDRELIGQRGASVVICPTSNFKLGVGDVDGKGLADAGVTLALGTDSALSGEGLDLRKEMVLAVERCGLSAEQAVVAATAGGAHALGLKGETGALTVGASADILAIEPGSGNDVWEMILSSQRIKSIWLAADKVETKGVG